MGRVGFDYNDAPEFIVCRLRALVRSISQQAAEFRERIVLHTLGILEAYMAPHRRKKGKRDSTEAPEGTTPLTVLQRFRMLIRAAQRHSNWVERQAGVSGAQLWAMQEIADGEGVRVGELADRMALHQSTVSNLLDKLEGEGLIARQRKSADQRVVTVVLTDSGKERLERAPHPTRGLLPESLRQMPVEDLEVLEKQLDRLLKQFHATDEGFGLQPLPFTE